MENKINKIDQAGKAENTNWTGIPESENGHKGRKEIIEEIFFQAEERQESFILKEPLKAMGTNVKNAHQKILVKWTDYKVKENLKSFQGEKKPDLLQWTMVGTIFFFFFCSGVGDGGK